MAPNVRVIHNVDGFSPRTLEGIGYWEDLEGSNPQAEKPIAAGVWDMLNTDVPSQVFEGLFDEFKYVVRGEAVGKNANTGEILDLKPGSLLWIPKGSKMSFISASKDCRIIYFEQRETYLLETPSPRSQSLQHRLDDWINDYSTQRPLSRAAADRSRMSLPGGTTRSVLDSEPFPITIKSAHGAQLRCADAFDYLDFVSDFTAGLFGHSEPSISQAVADAASDGFSLGAVTELECRLAEHLKERFPSMDLIRFCNSGTEANMYAIAAALAFTGRKKVLVFDRGYHGGTLTFGSSENPLNLPHKYVIGTYNDMAKTRSVLDSDIGAIVVEPMQSAGGMRPATEEFLSFLRDAATVLGAVLIFDEIVTSRLDYHGLQGVYNIEPDLTTLGKYIGGGMPFGAFGGKKAVMQQFDPRAKTLMKLSHSGTFNNNRFTMSAAVAASQLVTKERIGRINTLGENLRCGLQSIFAEAGLFEEITVSGIGSCIGLEFKGDCADILRNMFYFHNLRHGIWVGRRGFLALSFAHKEKDVDRVMDAAKLYLEEVSSQMK